jgi:hypothetical protein
MIRRLVILITALALALAAPVARALLGTHTLVIYAGGHMIAIKGTQRTAGAVTSNTGQRELSAPSISEAPRGLGGQAVAASSDYLYQAPPSISLDVYRQALCAAGPACDEAPAMYQALIDAGLDPALALAHSWKETSSGTAGAGRVPLRDLYGENCADEADFCDGRFSGFTSYTNATRAWASLMLTHGYIDAGLTMPDLVLPRYCPVDDGCDPAGYVAQIKQMVEGWRAAGSEAASPDR